MGKTIIWEHSDQEPDRLIEEGAWDKLIEYSSDNRDMLISEYLKGNKTDLAESVRLGAFHFNHMENMLKSRKKDYAIFSMGKVKGVLEILSRILGYEARTKTAENIVSGNLSGIKHLDEIVLKLDRNKTMTHSVLAGQLNDMRPSTLTENMKKISAYGLVYSTQVGKYKQYYLSDAGARYAAAIKKRRGKSGDVAAMRSMLEDLLQDKRVRAQTMDMMRQLLKAADEKTQDAICVAELGFSETDNRWKLSVDLENTVRQPVPSFRRGKLKNSNCDFNNSHVIKVQNEDAYAEA